MEGQPNHLTRYMEVPSKRATGNVFAVNDGLHFPLPKIRAILNPHTWGSWGHVSARTSAAFAMPARLTNSQEAARLGGSGRAARLGGSGRAARLGGSLTPQAARLDLTQ